MRDLILFFDTETTGFINKAKPLDHESQPHLVQFAAMLTSEDGRVYRATSVIIKPSGYEIPEASSNVHGITTKIADALGVGLGFALAWFIDALGCASLIVAHNAEFDLKVMKAQMMRESAVTSAEYLSGFPVFDTMKESTDLVKLPGRFGSYKWPKLNELHKFLFNEDFEGAHDALEDVRATMRCYFEIRGKTKSAITAKREKDAPGEGPEDV